MHACFIDSPPSPSPPSRPSQPSSQATHTSTATISFNSENSSSSKESRDSAYQGSYRDGDTQPAASVVAAAIAVGAALAPADPPAADPADPANFVDPTAPLQNSARLEAVQSDESVLTQAPPMIKCGHCSHASLDMVLCLGCHAAHYCDIVCQRNAWYFSFWC